MNIDRIPDELKARPQWVVWRAVIGENGNVTKPLYNPSNPAHLADHSDPKTWETFENAVRVHRNNPSIFAGIGFVFSPDDDYFGIDIDDEAKVKPEHLELRRKFVNQIVENVNTYAERSPSGKGLHLIGKGRLPDAGRKSMQMQVEIYGQSRYFTMTGDIYNNQTTITDQQSFLDAVFASFVARRTDELTDNESNRRLDLTDEEVIRIATNKHPKFAPRFNCQMECGPGEWSDTFMAIVGQLDLVTGKVEQVERIILNSPMVLDAPPNGGETRLNKAKRNLRTVLARVRQNNSGILAFAEHGRQQVENMERAKAERAKAAADSLRKAQEAIAKMSKGSATVLDAFPELTTEHKQLTRPPGVAGEFVAAAEKGSFKPFMKFAIPATLATFAGILSRGFKMPGGSGLNVNFILAAATSSGKTQSMKAWVRFMNDAVGQIGNTPSGPSRSRIINSSTSSIQAMMHDFMALPSNVWFIEECFAQLSAMTEGKSNTDSHLRDAYNQLYDAGEHGTFFSGPRSVANRKADIEPVNNLNVSTYWSTTTSKFDVFTEDALDGFLSRVIVIRHTTRGGELVQTTQELPDHLKLMLVQRMAASKALDEAYAMSAHEGAKLITTVSTGDVSDLIWNCMKAADAIANAAIEGKLPPAYAAVSRAPLTAQRIAGVLAVIENPYTPAITRDQYRWALGYVLQNLVALLSDVDQGELGAGASDETLAIVRAIKSMLSDKRYKALPGVPKSQLREYVKGRAPFHKSTGSYGRSQRVSDTLAHMLKEGMIEEIADPRPIAARGKPITLVCPVAGEPIWDL